MIRELPEEELDSMIARDFGERICDKTALYWAAAQLTDEASRIEAEILVAGVSAGDTTEVVVPDTVDRKEVKRLVSQLPTIIGQTPFH